VPREADVGEKVATAGAHRIMFRGKGRNGFSGATANDQTTPIFIVIVKG